MDTQLTAARGVIAALGGLLILGLLAWLGFWVRGELHENAPKAPPPPPPTERERNTCWLDMSKPGCAEIIKQTGPPAAGPCPLGGADEGNWSDGRRCAIAGQACPPGATCGSMFSEGANLKYYLGTYQPEAKPAPELPPTAIDFAPYDGRTTLTSLQHTDAGVPYDIPAMYPKNAVSSRAPHSQRRRHALQRKNSTAVKGAIIALKRSDGSATALAPGELCSGHASIAC